MLCRTAVWRSDGRRTADGAYPNDLLVAVEGMEFLSRNGLRYPIPNYGIQSDARAGLGVSYD